MTPHGEGSSGRTLASALYSLAMQSTNRCDSKKMTTNRHSYMSAVCGLRARECESAVGSGLLGVDIFLFQPVWLPPFPPSRV